jgi:hypothetical protein
MNTTADMKNPGFTLKKAIELSGKVSEGNTKMPSSTFAISAKHCNVGGKLVNIENSLHSSQKRRPCIW